MRRAPLPFKPVTQHAVIGEEGRWSMLSDATLKGAMPSLGNRHLCLDKPRTCSAGVLATTLDS